MKKIIFMTESMVQAGGVVRVITTWSNYFIKSREVKIVSVQEGKPYFDLDSRVEFEIEDFNFKNKIFGLLENCIKMYKFLKKNRDTIIIINKSLYIEPIYFLRQLGMFKDIKFVYFSHGGNSDFKEHYMKRFLTRHRVKMIFKEFDRVICLYKNIDDELMPKQVIKEKIFYIPNPIPYTEKEEMNKENIILFLGRVTKEKGVDTLIKAWKLLENKYIAWKLQIVGDGKDKEEFIELAQKLKLKNIEFKNSTQTPEEYYRKSKVFVLPSLFEGMPMVILEASFFENIVISSKTAGGLKMIEDGKNGYLFEIGNEEELSQKIEKVILDKEKNKQIIEKSNKDLEKYGIRYIAEKWREII